MGPLELGSSFFVTVLIGVAFGMALEGSGFGDSRKLTAQFYLYDMRVLKVMFTAVLVAMILIVLGDRFGFLDYSKLFVPPTFTWPVLLGGLLLGVGFLVGGFCPGTSLAASATLKLDAIFFVGGLFVGNVLFNSTANSFLDFFQNDSARGQVTLMDELGLPTGVIVLIIVLLAIPTFALGTMAERKYGTPEGERRKEVV